MLKSTKIIAGFPGIGKSFEFQNNITVCMDSDSFEFSWVKDSDGKNTKEKNPDFPKNYIEHIINNIGNADYIFVSSHDVVRKALVDAKVHFILVYPSLDQKEDYLQRYKDRGSPQGFIDLISNNWANWVTDCKNQDSCKKIELQKNQYLSTVLNFYR